MTRDPRTGDFSFLRLDGILPENKTWEQQLSKWGVQQLSDVIDRLIDTEIQIKSAGSVEPSTLTGQTLLGLVLRSRSLNR